MNSVALPKTGGRWGGGGRGGSGVWIGEEREGREKGVGREGRKERERDRDTERETDRQTYIKRLKFHRSVPSRSQR